MKILFKKVFWAFLLLAGIAGVIDTLVLALFFVGPDFGILFPGAAGIFLIPVSILKLTVRQNKPIITNRVLRQTFLAGVILWSLSFAAVQIMIISSSIPDRNIKADYLIILGAGLRGEEMSLSLYYRMVKGLQYARENPKVKIVVSGGQGHGELISEGEAMKRYLIANGIEPERIIKEDKSTSTMENFKLTKEILTNQGEGHIREIVVITNDFHMFRSKMLARRNGFIPHGLPTNTPKTVLLNCHIREYFALIKSYIYDR